MEVDSHALSTISDQNVEMNLKHHYLNKDSYILEVIERIKEELEGEKNAKALTVGCSVGRIPLELGKIVEESIGIDYTTRYFQMSTRLKESGCLKFKDIDIDLKSMNICHENVSLLQMNPENPDEHKISCCDLIILDGYSIKKGAIQEVIKQTLKLSENSAVLVVLNASGRN